ncbi:MAG: hypothetical protein IPK52_03650 [Chloroflexi bacterium]|nr:hypothetical protein [Chloroflexota bacterium]
MQTDFVPENLPSWMRQPRRSLDWGIALAAAFGLIASWAFLIRGGLPAYTDLIHSGFMTSDLADALREGQIIARWSPHALSGYGAPIPSFLPQGAPFLAALTAQLLTGDAASAIRLVLSAALVAAGVGQYLFCRPWIGATNALMAAGLYVFSPVLGLTAPHVTGDLAGVTGMALLPFVLWLSGRAAANTSGGDLIAACLALTALAFVSPRLALCTAAIALATASTGGIKSLIRLAACLLFSFALFAPSWLPALTEAGDVRWRTVAAPTRDLFDISSLFSPVHSSDPILLNPVPQFTLGLTMQVFCLVGIASALTRRRGRTFAALMTATALLAAAAAVLFNQPWLTYPMTFAAAALGGLALEWRVRLPVLLRRTVLPIALVIVLITTSDVWLSPLGPTADDFTPLAQIEFEQNGFGTAVLPAGAYTPSTLPVSYAPERRLIESYRNPPLERIRLGSAARVTPITSSTHGSTWQVSLTAQNSVLLSLSYFPGWQADLDGKPLPLERDPVTGLIRVTIPAVTNGTLRVSMGTTPERNLAWVLAIGAAAALLVWARMNIAVEAVNEPHLGVQELRLTVVALGFAGAAVVATAIPGGAFDLRADPFSGLRGSFPITATSESVQLLAYQVNSTRIRPGDPLSVTLFWSTAEIPETNYGARVGLLDMSTSRTHYLTSPAAPGDLPTRRWLTGYVVVDTYNVVSPDTLAQGTYQVVVEVTPCTASCNLSDPLRFRDSQGISRPAIVLPSVLTIAE